MPFVVCWLACFFQNNLVQISLSQRIDMEVDLFFCTGPERHSLDLEFTSRPLKLSVFGWPFWGELFIDALRKHLDAWMLTWSVARSHLTLMVLTGCHPPRSPILCRVDCLMGIKKAGFTWVCSSYVTFNWM